VKGAHQFKLRRKRIDSDIIDVSDLPLDALAGIPHPVLERALRRAVREAAEGSSNTVAFRSVITAADAFPRA
jgi:FXSXX-COOH protein